MVPTNGSAVFNVYVFFLLSIHRTSGSSLAGQFSSLHRSASLAGQFSSLHRSAARKNKKPFERRVARHLVRLVEREHSSGFSLNPSKSRRIILKHGETTTHPPPPRTPLPGGRTLSRAAQAAQGGANLQAQTNRQVEGQLLEWVSDQVVAEKCG